MEEKLVETYKKVIQIDNSELFNLGIHEFMMQLESILNQEKGFTKTERENLEGYVRQLASVKSYNEGDKKGQFRWIMLGVLIAITGSGLIEISEKYSI